MQDEEDKPSSTCSLKRHPSTDTESSIDGTDNNSPPHKKRNLNESHGSSSERDTHSHSDSQGGGSSGNESEKSAISIDIPKYASSWKALILPALRVTQKSDISFNPYDIFGKIEERSTRYDPKHRAKLDCYQMVVKSLMEFEASSIDGLTSQQIEESYRKVKSLKLNRDLQEWLNIDYVNTSKADLTEMCFRIMDRVQQFMSQLLYMVNMDNKRRTQNKDSLSEGMFQELFTRYAKIFGLEVMCIPNVPAYELVIGNNKVIVEPDALVVNPALENAVLAIIEVKKSYSREADEQTVRNLRKSQKSVHQTNHISSDIKGQHLAQMLAVLPDSAFCSKPKRLYGFIVQGTEVTVTSFSLLNEGYLDNLKEGCLPREYCAEMKYSTTCNILSQQGRLGLVSTLVEMSAVS